MYLSGGGVYVLSCWGRVPFLLRDNKLLDLPMFQVMDTVDNVTKDCLSNCEDQVNDLFVTTSNYPNRKTFKDREEFCILGKKLLTATCKFPKRLPLTADFPELCDTLEALPDFLLQCKNNRSYSWSYNLREAPRDRF